MSNISLAELLSIIEKELTASKEFRDEMERKSTIQLMDLNKPLFIETTTRVFGLDNNTALNIYKAVERIFVEHERKTISKKGNLSNPSINFKIEKALNLKKNYAEYADSFIVDSFRWVQEHLYSTWAEEIAKVTKQNIKDVQPKLTSSSYGGVNIEHGGGSGSPLAGARAVRGIEVAKRAFEYLGFKQEDYFPILEKAIKTSNKALKLDVIYNTSLTKEIRVDSDQVLAEYVFSLKLGSAKSNNDSSALEGAAGDAFRKTVVEDARNFLQEQGITTISNIVVDHLLKDLTLDFKGKKGGKTVIRSAESKTGQIKDGTYIDVNKNNQGILPTAPVMAKPEARVEPTDLDIKRLLSAKLTEEIRRRMTYPRLVYRTGRFAASVDIIGLTKDSTGTTTLSYTYDKDPYQIFEPGVGKPPWATRARDPRGIIEDSIREIAVGIIDTKFNLRRV
jgi:hypothetical protein